MYTVESTVAQQENSEEHAAEKVTSVFLDSARLSGESGPTNTASFLFLNSCAYCIEFFGNSREITIPL